MGVALSCVGVHTLSLGIMSFVSDREDGGKGASSDAESQDFARLIALELECARLRLALGIGARGPSVEALPASDVFPLLERYATDFFSVHAADGTYLYASPSGEQLFGHPTAMLIGRSAYDYIHPDDFERIAENHRETMVPSLRPPIEYRLRRADGSYVWVETRSDAAHTPSALGEIICVTRDITERREASEAQARLIAELEHRIDEVRQLTGLLPICAWCKSIRDDEGYWHQVEAYFARRGHLEFTHGACPSCAATLRKRGTR